MKNSITAILLFFFTIAPFSAVFSQIELKIKQSCAFASGDTEGSLYTYDASKEALVIIDSIMKANNLPQNFTVKAADCANALATSEGKKRYILYSTAFLENFKRDAKTKWAAYCVLAHEIGHHLSNHDLEDTTPSVRRRFELEADRFAGGVLFKLGATLDNAQAGIHTFSNEKASNTHPSKNARLEAIAVGWKQAQEFAEKSAEREEPVEEVGDEKALFQRALAEKDPEKAIELLDTLIENNGNFTDAYLERGKRQKDKEEGRRNFNDAIEDFNAYIKIRAKNPIAYFERGYAYSRIVKFTEAIADFDKAIRIKPDYAEAYVYRARAKYEAEKWDAAKNDLNLAIKYKPDYAEAYYWLGKYLSEEGKFAEAIVQLDKALKLDTSDFDALNARATAKQFSNKFADAIADYNLLQARHPQDFDSYFDRAKCYQAVKKHIEAITDWDKVIEKAIATGFESSEGYAFRGISKAVLGKKTDAQTDFDKAIEITILKNNTRTKIGCMLVEYGFYQDAIVWLDKALESQPIDDSAEKCKAEALARLKK